jgi:hypothetical protein
MVPPLVITTARLLHVLDDSSVNIALPSIQDELAVTPAHLPWTEQLFALGVPEDRIYIDRGFSGTTRPKRSGLDQALAAVWGGTVFTVTKFDRFARNMADANQILTDLSDRGVQFGLGASVYDWKDPFGRLFLQTLAMVAAFEATWGTCAPAKAWPWPSARASSRASSPNSPNPRSGRSAAATPLAKSPSRSRPPNLQSTI